MGKTSVEIKMKKLIFLEAMSGLLILAACTRTVEDSEITSQSQCNFTEESEDEIEMSVFTESEETGLTQIQWNVYISPDIPEPFIEVLEQYEQFMNAENQKLSDADVQEKLWGGEWRYLYDELCAIWLMDVEYGETETICYSLKDLTGDGFPEMIMGAGGIPWIVYYFSEKERIQMECTSKYFRMTLYAGGVIEYVSAGVHSMTYYLQFQNDLEKWECVDWLSDIWDNDKKEVLAYFHVKDRLEPIPGEESYVEEPISKEEYLQIQKKYTTEPIELEWMPLVQEISK